MATLKCSDMGGKCDTEITADTPEEMVTKGYAHVKEFHAEMIPDIDAMTPGEMEHWRKTNIDPAFEKPIENAEDHDTKEVEMI